MVLDHLSMVLNGFENDLVDLILIAIHLPLYPHTICDYGAERTNYDYYRLNHRSLALTVEVLSAVKDVRQAIANRTPFISVESNCQPKLTS